MTANPGACCFMLSSVCVYIMLLSKWLLRCRANRTSTRSEQSHSGQQTPVRLQHQQRQQQQPVPSPSSQHQQGALADVVAENRELIRKLAATHAKLRSAQTQLARMEAEVHHTGVQVGGGVRSSGWVLDPNRSMKGRARSIA